MSDHTSVTCELKDDQIVALTRSWLEQAVIGLNLCPFANAVLRKGQVAFHVSRARSQDELWQDLLAAIEALLSTPAATVDTLLLIHPWALLDFVEFNDFTGYAEALLEENGLAGVLQLASFHPQYQFADVAADDPTNHTNHAPFPTLHLLRENSLDQAIAAMPDTDAIVTRNLDTMRRLGHAGWQALQARIYKDAGH